MSHLPYTPKETCIGLPLHFTRVLHSSLSIFCPTQFFPPYKGWVQSLVLVFVPPPQVLLQVPQLLQLTQYPFTGQF